MAKNKFRITADVFSGKGKLSKEETSANILFNAILNNELKDNKKMFKAFETLYNENVRDKDAPKMDQVDKMFQQMPPKDLGKFLFRKTYAVKETKSLQGKPNITENHQAKFEKAASLLQANARKTESGLLELNPDQKKEAVKNLVSNLSFKQMQNVVKAVEGYEDYNKKSWLSKALTKFVDCVCRKFNSAKTSLVKEGLQELITKGAKVETEINKQGINAITSTRGGKGVGGR